MCVLREASVCSILVKHIEDGVYGLKQRAYDLALAGQPAAA